MGEDWAARFPELFRPRFEAYANADLEFRLGEPARRAGDPAPRRRRSTRTGASSCAGRSRSGGSSPAGGASRARPSPSCAAASCARRRGAPCSASRAPVFAYQRATSRNPEPYRPHFTHPVSAWAYAVARVEVTGPTDQPARRRVRRRGARAPRRRRRPPGSAVHDAGARGRASLLARGDGAAQGLSSEPAGAVRRASACRPARSARGAGRGRRLRLVGQGALDPHLDPVVGQPLGDPLAPLDHGDRLVERGVEVEVVELGDAAEPVGVDVHQRRPVAERRVHPRDHERRRRDVAAHAEPGAEPLGERRLAGAELAGAAPRRRRPAGSVASDAPSARIDVGVGRVVRRAGRGRRSSTYGEVPPVSARSRARARTCWSPAAPRGPAPRRRRTPSARASASVDQRGGDAVALRTSGSTPTRRSHSVRSLGVEDQRADVAAVVVRRDQAAVRRAPRRATPRSRRARRRAGRATGRVGRPRARSASTVGASSGPTRRTRWSSRGPTGSRRAAASSWSSSALTSSCRSMITMCPAPSHSSSVEPAMWACSLRLWPIEVSLSAVPQMIAVGTTDERLDGLELVERGEVREELRDHLERRRREHLRRRTRRTTRARRRRTPARRWRPWPPSGRSGAARRRCRWPRASTDDEPLRELRRRAWTGSTGSNDPVRLEAAGGGRDQRRRRRSGRRTARGAPRPAR